MTKKACGNCRHFAKEPNAGGRGCCFLSDDLGSYPVKGEHYAPCREWKLQTNWQRWFGTPEKAVEALKEPTDRCCFWVSCQKCPLEGYCGTSEAILEWLESEAK